MEVSIIGSGNVAHHLAKVLTETGYTIKQIFSRSIDNAMQLAKTIPNCEAIDQFPDLKPTDLIVLAVSDAALPQVVEQFPFVPQRLVHTAGAVTMDALKGKAKEIGVFYPLQTFTKQKEIDWKTTPLFIEADSSEFEYDLLKIAHSISNQVTTCSSADRKLLHISAVFACNFTNHCWAIAEKILQKNNLPFNSLFPLIDATWQKAQQGTVHQSQTGPAIRNDQNTLTEHEHILEKEGANLLHLYQLFNRSIGDFSDETEL